MTYCRKNDEAMCLIRSQIGASGEHGGDRKSEEKQVCNTRLKSQTVKAHISRLKRDRPDLAEKVVNGDMTANEAAIEAGFRKRMVSMPAEPDQFIEAAQKLLHKRVLLLEQESTHPKIGESCKTFFVRTYDREVGAAVHSFGSARELHTLSPEIGFQNYRFMMGKWMAWSMGIECQRSAGARPQL